MGRMSKIKCQKAKITCLLVMCCWLVGYSVEPSSALKITIPDYKVTKGVEVDQVEIPDGEILLLEEGRPKVPYYIKSIDYPKDYRVQNVTLKERSEPETATGLRLPVVITGPRPTIPPKMKDGLYPEKDYEWRLWENPDGSTTLVISLYPFYFDPKTSDVKFYKDYQVDIKYIKTTVSITELTTDKTIYEPNEKVKITVKTANTGKPKDVSVRVKIRRYGSDEMVDSLPPRLLKKLSDRDSLALEWQTAGFPPLDYYAEVFLNDDRLNLLDRKRISFCVGSAVAEITKFIAEPQHFRLGDKINISLNVKNTGTREISGDCIFRIQEDGNIIKKLSQNFTKLKPGGLLSFNDAWNTKEAKKGTVYGIVGYVRYDGTATETKRVIVSTNLMPVANLTFSPEKSVAGGEISFDAAGSKDPDGSIAEYSWDFGDGGTGSGVKVTHTYYQPGDYETILTVKDNENGTDEIKQKITIAGDK